MRGRDYSPHPSRHSRDGKKRPRELVAAEALCRSLLERIGYNPEHYAVFEIWDRLLGREAAKAKATGIRGQRLCVEVDCSARMHDIMMRKRSLLKKLNEHFGTRRVISDIILELAASRRPPSDGADLKLKR